MRPRILLFRGSESENEVDSEMALIEESYKDTLKDQVLKRLQNRIEEGKTALNLEKTVMKELLVYHEEIGKILDASQQAYPVSETNYSESVEILKQTAQTSLAHYAKLDSIADKQITYAKQYHLKNPKDDSSKRLHSITKRRKVNSGQMKLLSEKRHDKIMEAVRIATSREDMSSLSQIQRDISGMIEAQRQKVQERENWIVVYMSAYNELSIPPSSFQVGVDPDGLEQEALLKAQSMVLLEKPEGLRQRSLTPST